MTPFDKLPPIKGTRFGKFEVISSQITRSTLSGRKGAILWRVRCDCGTVRHHRRSDLITGRIQNCVNCREGNKLSKGESGFRTLWRGYRQTAKSKQKTFSLSKHHFKNLVTSPCSYCKLPPAQVAWAITSHGQMLYNGIDRKDPSKGYTKGNSVSCCGWCNRAKWNKSVEEYQAWLGFIRNAALVEESAEEGRRGDI